ncbi:hypothetical protein SAMN05216497_1502 [Clostridium cochlearium]|uniref:Phosphoesterase n=1 Tax=Clostridium cochlearium TaxID=1494 RepID=A0ABY0QQ70_CLOCO|nr:DUF1294 domain-containing protein [Clostridium cochlearium]SDL47339.1 hypothetical protein SAMN05216497_1502 [Clostridium cochlearium]
MIRYFKCYFILINLLGLLFMYIDKEKAKRSKWRIKESTLFSIAMLGGSIGAYIGMKTFRHKTKHAKFKYGIPIIILIQLLIFLYWGNNSVLVSHYFIKSSRLPSEFNGYKIVQISDLHNKVFPKNNTNLIKSIKDEKPDSIFIQSW